jgi:hypothetical protein
MCPRKSPSLQEHTIVSSKVWSRGCLRGLHPRGPDSYYSDCFESAEARDTTPRNAHIGTATTQIVHSIEACYIAPVGHFQMNMKFLKEQLRFSTGGTQTQDMSERRRLLTRDHDRHQRRRIVIHSRPNSEHHTSTRKRGAKGGIEDPKATSSTSKRQRRPRHRRTYLGIDQKQVRKTQQPKRPMTTGTIVTLTVPYNISTNHLHTKHILNTPR